MIYLSGAVNLRWLGKRPDLGAMFTYMPRRSRIARADLAGVLGLGPWAADNGCWTNPDMDVDHYLDWCERHAVGRTTCLFVTAPDVVADPAATWQRARPVLPRIRALGYQVAYVAQDGIGMHAPWDEFDVLFIGGTTEWKLSASVCQLMELAKEYGKQVHMGRVNSWRRLRRAALSLCDSVDGTMLVFNPSQRLKQLNGWLDTLNDQPFLAAPAADPSPATDDKEK